MTEMVDRIRPSAESAVMGKKFIRTRCISTTFGYIAY